MPDDGEESDSGKQRMQNIIDNPHIAAWFFNKRFETFFQDVLVPRWNIVDWWYRYEWQHRGSVHVHGIGKKRDAPQSTRESTRLYRSNIHVAALRTVFVSIKEQVNKNVDLGIPRIITTVHLYAKIIMGSQN
jgi:hypothetical protein